MEHNQPINGDCWLAYFDILGFKDWVAFVNRLGSRNTLKNFSVQFVLEKYEKALKWGKQFDAMCKFKWFSDSFIFYTDNDFQESFYGVLAASELFFQEMFLEGIPMRGCLNVGQLYVDEEKDIFFGQALIDAYLLAEGQNWIGLVLSENARQRSARFKSTIDFQYLEYEVPCQKLTKKETEPNRLLVFYPNIRIIESFPEQADSMRKRLLEALDNMENEAQTMNRIRSGNKGVVNGKDHEYAKIIRKYRDTRNFLSNAHPLLRGRFEQKYPIPKETNDDGI